MSRKRIVIVDDEQDARLLLRQYANAYENIDIVAECSDGAQAIFVIDNLKPDWVFLDIQMPGINGFKVLQSITHIPQIVFSTAYDSFALDAFEHNAVDYLLKPYSWLRFSKAISKLMTDVKINYQSLQLLDDLLLGQNQSERRFFVYHGKKMVAVKAGDIILLEASDDYTKVYTRERSYLSHTGISGLAKRLDAEIFIRVHRSFIINIHEAIQVFRNTNGMYINLSNDKVIKVSRTYQENIKRLIL